MDQYGVMKYGVPDSSASPSSVPDWSTGAYAVPAPAGTMPVLPCVPGPAPDPAMPADELARKFREFMGQLQPRPPLESETEEFAGTSIEQDLKEAERLFGLAMRRIRNALAKHRAQEGT